jgi:hypothetical protein
MDQDTSGGAQNFAIYFYRAIDWSLATTDPYLIARVSAADCSGCNAYINRLSALAEAGGHVQGGRILVSGEQLSAGDLVKSDYVVQVTLAQQPVVVIRPSAAPSTVAGQATGVTNDLYVSWVSGHWVALEIGLDA